MKKIFLFWFLFFLLFLGVVSVGFFMRISENIIIGILLGIYFLFQGISFKKGWFSDRNWWVSSVIIQLLFAVLSSLYYSNFGDPVSEFITGQWFDRSDTFDPCQLCWWARILMFPLLPLMILYVVSRSRPILWYIYGVSGAGILLEFFHYLLQKTSISNPFGCTTTNPCSALGVQYFGFITIPFLCLIAFLVIHFFVFFLLFLKRLVRKGEPIDYFLASKRGLGFVRTENAISVTVILTVYKRIDYLEKQIHSLLTQTIPITNFIINVNNKEVIDRCTEIVNRLIPNSLIVNHSHNLGVWSRFFLAFNVQTEFVFILDDDIIPGEGWIENCTKSYREKPGIYGSWGSRFKSLTIRMDREVISESENIPNTIEEVDISGHSWFFAKKDLPKMFDRLPDIDRFQVCGEELWISYRARENGIPTYIPPMDRTIGNKEPDLGNSEFAGYNLYGDTLYQDFYTYAIRDGFIPLKFK